ncbi:hypothetical protein FGIG_11493 [Fasciola gigantica]|uniref:Uncharacterized protein n=1 Tax=Fasciola gigantica TaxID=46835 RepID=A0A504YT85_FASGI|nr:hypothetical protein FGIG_11493 [Fasciola gigantica]
MRLALMHHFVMVTWSFGRDGVIPVMQFDVLCSSCIPFEFRLRHAIERFWATENPISYASQKTRRRCTIMLVSVWICSITISFPAVAWWRRTDDYHDDGPNEWSFRLTIRALT